MVADPVSLNPALRPWQRAGVEFLLADQALPAPYSLCIAAPALGAGGRIGAGLTRPNAQSSPNPAGGPTTSPVGAAGTAAYAGGPRTGATGTVRPASPQVPPASGYRQEQSIRSQPAAQNLPANQHSAGHESSQPLPYIHPDKWPAIWQQRLQKTAPAAVLWTYWALGEDMCVRPNPTRRALLQKMLADLGHPAGTHSFWPAALPQSMGEAPQAPMVPVDTASTESGLADSAETLLYPAPEVFWSGVQYLKARAVVVMGSPAIKALDLPPRLRPFQQTRHHGTLVVVLRDVDFLAQEITRYDAVKAFLRQALAPFGR